MKQQIENIIKENLPKEHTHWKGELSGTAMNTDGLNQALSEIPVSLIADKVLKVVVKKIIEEYGIDFNNGCGCCSSTDLQDELTKKYLSPNKENK